ncbi:metallo-beta-lactamase domain protein [Apiospora sp. TS-2023a]
MGVGGYQQINKSFNVCAFEDYLTTQLKRLPYLKDVEQISPRVIRILGQNPGKFTLQGTNTYIVGTGPSRLIIDTAQGIPEWADLVEATLKDLGITLSHILLTHWHGDHTGGHSPSKCQREIRDGDVFAVEGATVRGFHTPGHSHDHMCFILVEENAMFTGDNILGHGTSAVENLGLLIATWRKMLTQGCQVGYPAHGAVVPNLELKIKGELAGKARREAQVMEKLRLLEQSQTGGGGGGKRASVTVKQLVVMMHGEAVNEEVRILALEPFMEEVLRKLAEDGNVGFEIRGGEKKWFGL